MSQSESVEQVAPEANGDSPFIKPVNEPLFMTSSTTSVEPSSAIASAVPVKPYNPQPKKSVLEMTSVLDSDRRALIESESDDSLSSDDSDYQRIAVKKRRGTGTASGPAKWWFQEPAIKKNICIVIGAWILVFLGIASFITGIALEGAYHTENQDILRGIIFFIIAVVVLLPSVYAVVHIYLAAKRVGVIRFSNVWFFR
ncbi:transmembrane protein 134-like [Halichondria panicea]|uniref:transmembrane protein 134-like n=1 Tax=Halichondria panicea TaxID=6063 RepID=UPI00312B5335